MNEPNTQIDFFTPELENKFNIWADSPGGRQVLRIAYAITAKYATRFLRTGRRVSMKLIYEIMRDNIAFIKARTRANGLVFHKVDGFALNNNFHAYMARHILTHKPKWAGLFETREVGKL